MSESPTLNRAARIIAQISPDAPADYVLRGELGAARTLSPAEKRDITRAVFTYFRWLAWTAEADSVQSRLEQTQELQARFDKDPLSIKAEALAARAVPAWVRDEIDLQPDYLRQLQRDPVLWIRPQNEFAPAVARALGPVAPAKWTAPYQVARRLHALRYTGTKDLFKTDEFHKGVFEIQDLASQLVGHACDPQAKETWWDTCCGEGGKTLHLADLMDNSGVIWATDRSTRRLAALRKRTSRAHVYNYRALTWNGGPFLPTKTKFDGILVDAPCSGVGTWQRNPHARWTTTANDVTELAAIQAQILNHVAPALKPGGRLIYAVCTLTRRETTAIADAFTAAHPELEPLPLLGATPQLTLWPQDLDANGMFIAGWRRK